ncbi:MAG: hypothetical protein ABL918_12210 [Chakrabartia sp.]
MTEPTIGPILEEVGQLIADVLGDVEPEGAFMYAEAGDMWQGASIFKDLGDRVIYRDPSEELCDAIERLWVAAEPDKKWAVLSYTISDGTFDAQFKFPDDIDPEDNSFERRERALSERYGDKPVDYTDPWGDGKSNG